MQHHNQHTVEQFDVELAELKRRTLAMGQALKAQLHAAGEILATIDETQARAVADADETINRLEIDLDAYVEFLLSRRQPQASDLRMLIGTLRVSVDFERAGDEIRSAAKGVRNQRGQLAAEVEDIWPSTMKLHALTSSMLDDAIALLQAPSSSLAYALIQRRTVVRQEMKRLVNAVIDAMTTERIKAVDGLEIIRIARAFERVSAHLQNVGETVIFVLDGVDVRHEHVK